MSEIFDSRFRNLLAEILRHTPRFRRAHEVDARGSRRRRSESGTFSGHRAYTAGEDLRLLDWNVLARTDELFLKVLEDQDTKGITLVLDCSPSMRAGRRWQGAMRLAAILGGLALTRMDGLQLVVGRGRLHMLEGAGALNGYLDLLAGLETRTASPTRLARTLLESGWHRRVGWVSDFAQPETMRPALKLLRQQGCLCIGWLPWIEDDHDPGAAGYIRFLDPESGREEVMLVDGALRAAMRQELHDLAILQDRVFQRASYSLQRFPVPRPGDYGLTSWLEGVVGGLDRGLPGRRPGAMR